jgi:tRNA A37 methylthiotransferase MiaB
MEDLIGAIRYKIPNICLRTTLIAGFPGETQDDVEELKQFLQKIKEVIKKRFRFFLILMEWIIKIMRYLVWQRYL